MVKAKTKKETIDALMSVFKDLNRAYNMIVENEDIDTKKVINMFGVNMFRGMCTYLCIIDGDLYDVVTPYISNLTYKEGEVFYKGSKTGEMSSMAYSIGSNSRESLLVYLQDRRELITLVIEKVKNAKNWK